MPEPGDPADAVTTPAGSLPEGLSGHAFGRSGCEVVPGERLLAARARGSAAECAIDAAELLRKGHMEQARQLLHSALYYVGRHGEKS